MMLRDRVLGIGVRGALEQLQGARCTSAAQRCQCDDVQRLDIIGRLRQYTLVGALGLEHPPVLEELASLGRGVHGAAAGSRPAGRHCAPGAANIWMLWV